MSLRIQRGGPWAAQLLSEVPARGTGAWLQERGRVLKRDSHSLVALAEVQGETCYLKYYAAKKGLQRAGFALGLGRGVRAYDSAVCLATAGIPVPAAKACLLLDDGMLLVAEGMPGARDLKAIWVEAPATDEQQMLLSLAGELLATLHGGGFAHGDCKWSNLLWSHNRFYLVDLEAVTRCAVGHRRQARDLARFTVNAEDLGVKAVDYQFFLDAYCAGTGFTAAQLTGLMRPDLDRLRERHRQKYGERGARLL
ncbi:MAG: lipopolysaccharide kinase InaA family protein [Halioglobus sp.]